MNMKNKSGLKIYLRSFCFFLILIIFSCKQTSNSAEENNNSEKTPERIFYGKLQYKVTATGSDSNSIALFFEFAPHTIDIYYKNNLFRMVEHGGLSNGNLLINQSLHEGWQLDTLENIAYKAEYSNLDSATDKLKELMPQHFSPDVEATGEADTIAGILCEKYKVLRSGFIPENSQAYFWATKEFIFPPSRFDMQSEINRVAVPPPLNIGYKYGAILKMQIIENNITVTYTATYLQETNLPDSIFTIPGFYTKSEQ